MVSLLLMDALANFSLLKMSRCVLKKRVVSVDLTSSAVGVLGMKEATQALLTKEEAKGWGMASSFIFLRTTFGNR